MSLPFLAPREAQNSFNITKLLSLRDLCQGSASVPLYDICAGVGYPDGKFNGIQEVTHSNRNSQHRQQLRQHGNQFDPRLGWVLAKLSFPLEIRNSLILPKQKALGKPNIQIASTIGSRVQISVFRLEPFPRSAIFFRSTLTWVGTWKAAEKLIRHWEILRGDSVMLRERIWYRNISSKVKVMKEGSLLLKPHFMPQMFQVLDPVTGKPCKVGVRYVKDGTKVRVSRGIGASGSIIPLHEILKIRTTPRAIIAGPKDTPMDLVLEKTYNSKTGKAMPNLYRMSYSFHPLKIQMLQNLWLLVRYHIDGQ
ncbi:50S ribosomal L24 [Quillaja saponaria]|uniref:50S ribosomal L24 n=1 Tax=Quillaja saponaria TaxID=32244 RepID=A0AAD7VJ20_QUISA|nr:50S ribosomal L24 [Quillaja saponaria]